MCVREIIIFAKSPVPGRVKTRLIGPLSALQAAELHRRCLRLTLQAASGVTGADVVLAASPDNADFRDLADPTIERRPQGDGGLDRRLARAVDRAFGNFYDAQPTAVRARSKRILLVGSDCPTLTSAELAEAFEELEHFDVVIGPALDGGYYLLGLRRPTTALFDGIEWSTPHVSAQTIRRASELGLTVAELRPRRDIDVYDDVVASAREIDDSCERLLDFRAFLHGLVANGDHRD